MKNQYKFHARKRDTQMIEIYQKSDPKRRWQMRKKLEQKTCQNKIEKKGPGPERNSAARRREHYKIKYRR